MTSINTTSRQASDQRSPPGRFLGRVFIAWIALGNALWWFGPADLQMLLGNGLLWSTLIPLTCLAAINPRRALGTLLAVLAAVALVLISVTSRLGLSEPRSRSQATLL